MPQGKYLQAVAETRVFSEDIDAMLSREEREAVINALAENPAGGAAMPGTGGLRKRRIALPGRGKRGGARVVTLFLGENWPVYAVFIYAKNERESPSPAQARRLARVVEAIKLEARERKKSR